MYRPLNGMKMKTLKHGMMICFVFSLLVLLLEYYSVASFAPGPYEVLRKMYNEQTIPEEHMYLKGKCSWAWRPSDMKFFTQERKVFILLNYDGDTNCNIFHQLWLYLPVVRYAFRSGVLPLAKVTGPVTVVFGLPQCFKWSEMLIKGYPLDGLPVTVEVEYVPKGEWGTFMERHGTTTETCFAPQHHGAFRFLPTHESWRSSDYSVDDDLERWLDSVREQHNFPSKDQVCGRTVPKVLFMERKGKASRTVTDIYTKKPLLQTHAKAIEALGFQVESAVFDDLTVEEQARVVSDANILITAHGAQQTNMIYLYRCPKNAFQTAMIEVTARLGFCQAEGHEMGVEYTREKLLELFHRCSNRYFMKADYFALSQVMGFVRYIEVMIEAMGFHNFPDGNPIKNTNFYVDPEIVLEQLKRLKADNAYDYHQQGTYNGIEGVEPYEIS